MSVRTDLAVEAHEIKSKEAAEEIEGVTADKEERNGISLTRVRITSESASKLLGKAQGTYITIETPNLRYGMEDHEAAADIIAKEITDMADITENTTTLIAGLGNRDITPDALGCAVVSDIFITNHLHEGIKSVIGENISSVCAIAPGVLGTTGIETVEIIKGITEKIKPQLVIAVDALAAADIRRVNTTIQIADTGIQPGAGVGNDRRGLNEETLGVKVIAIGVPTVIDAESVCDMEIPDELAPLIVTTKDIDIVIERMAKTVACGINRALQPKLSHEEIESYIR